MTVGLISINCLYWGSLNELELGDYYEYYRPDMMIFNEMPRYWFIDSKNYYFQWGIHIKYSYNPFIYNFTACILESNFNCVIWSSFKERCIDIYEIYLI